MSQMASNILYYADSAPVTQKDIENALADAGIKKGDTIMVHSDIGSFGKLGTLDREFLLQSLVKSLKNTIGPDGTIIMPTFTYSFNKHEPYDIKNTKSTVGTLTEYFRKQKDVSRTAHPTHSAAIWGKHKKELLNIGKGTFDKSSIFGKFHQMNGKFVSFGVPLHMSCTFIHYIEHIHKVPYRYIKKIKGKIKYQIVPPNGENGSAASPKRRDNRLSPPSPFRILGGRISFAHSENPLKNIRKSASNFRR